ncbi:Uncharacterized protein APZ42_032158 [Daphnia magna]|uniref:Reverse transcriptase domain-containing protein n=1 Tax=Daphnia magna TaxID=35525 RepID=A0A164M6K7_9CRUS|nr:Uncharacterized protein APZ42_032158 [Daphnia magna]
MNGDGRYKTSMISRILKSDWDPPEALKESNDLWVELCSTKADKGGKTVIWGREDYKREALRQLGDKDTYMELTQAEAEGYIGKIHKHKILVTNALEKHKCITKAEETGGHRSLAARPIIAAVGSPFKALDEYLAKLTACLLPCIPGSLIDTAALLRDLATVPKLPKEAKLFSADVVSLYPSIDWVEAVDDSTNFYIEHKHVVEKFCEDNNMLPPPPHDIFRYILQTLLENNVFHLQNEKYYRQLKGTAMGCSMSVFMANTFMYRKTRHLIESPPADLLYFGRYIDDIIAVWTGSNEDIPNIFDGEVDDNIKLTFAYGGKTLEALDLLIEIEDDGTLSTRLYRKPTEGTQFVHWTSAHPDNLKSSIPYAQLLRIKRNCSKVSDFIREAETLLRKFENRGYPQKVLDKACSKALLKDRTELLITGGSKKFSVDERFTLVSDYNEALAQPLRVNVRSFYSKLQASPLIVERVERLGQQLPLEPPRIAFRAGKSLGSSLGPIFKKGRR